MKDKFAAIANIIDVRLATVFKSAFESDRHPLFHVVPPLEINTELKALTLRGGKRLRPALMVAAYELFNDEALDDCALLDAACAMEALQSYFLIHDDIMDGDTVRRNGPSVHASLQQKTGDAALGLHLGILAGDLAAALHEWILARLDCDAAIRTRVQRIFSRMHMDVVLGQALDLQGNASPEDIVLRKTASYTTIGPLCLGAALGGATDSDLAHMAELARPLGIAFQYRDDLIGVFGDEKVAGKPVGSDLKNGKQTLLLTDTLAHLEAANRAALLSLIEAAPQSSDAVTGAMEIIDRSGARARCEHRIDKLFSTVAAHLQTLAAREPGKSFLLWLARLMAYREM
ncbi:MAG: polyprenyl synthetase family protein [Deltaproteobacteria bacterium]|nr:polyprenyl synthetase family protein [Deltaproteobacteria bacterium]